MPIFRCYVSFREHSCWFLTTLSKTDNLAPENSPSQKETIVKEEPPLFRGYVSFREDDSSLIPFLSNLYPFFSSQKCVQTIFSPTKTPTTRWGKHLGVSRPPCQCDLYDSHPISAMPFAHFPEKICSKLQGFKLVVNVGWLKPIRNEKSSHVFLKGYRDTGIFSLGDSPALKNKKRRHQPTGFIICYSLTFHFYLWKTFIPSTFLQIQTASQHIPKLYSKLRFKQHFSMEITHQLTTRGVPSWPGLGISRWAPPVKARSLTTMGR